MRILILTQYFPPEIGASQTRLLEFGRALQRREWDVEVVTALPSYPTGRIFNEYRGSLFRRETIEGIPVTRFWAYATKDVSLPKRMAAYGTFCAASLLSLFSVRRPDIVFVESPPLSLPIAAFALSRAWGCPWVLNVSDLWPDSAVGLGIMSGASTVVSMSYRLERFLYAKASAVTALTEGIRRTLVERKRVQKGKVLWLPNGVNADMFTVRRPSVWSPKKTFLYAGLLGTAHGVGVIVEAAARLVHRPDVFFRIVGDGPENRALSMALRERGLTNVWVEPPVPLRQMPVLLSEAYAFIVTLKDAQFLVGTRPAKMMPALAAAVPIVYSGRGEGADLIASAGAGITVPPQRDDELARAVEWLADHPDEARVMGERGRAYAVEHCSWDKLVAEWLEQLEAAIPVLSRTGAADCCVTRR